MKQKGQKMDWNLEIDNIANWMREYLESSGCKGYVILTSGGIDSSVVSCLCCKAVGPENVIAVSLPCETREDMKNDAVELTNNLGVELKVIDIEETYNTIVKGLLSVGEIDTIALENIKSRLRMVAGYGIANTENHLLAGTGNLSEDSISFFTKFGDGGVDILPLGNYYKTEIYQLAEFMPEIPDSIKTKAPCADLSPDQKSDEEIFGITYKEIDKILKGLDPDDLQSLEGIDINKIGKIMDMIKKGEHKNKMPPKCPRL